MAKKKRKTKWKVTVEADKDLKNNDNLYNKSCELCGRRCAGKDKMSKLCAECIISSNNCNFKLAAKYKKEKK